MTDATARVLFQQLSRTTPSAALSAAHLFGFVFFVCLFNVGEVSLLSL
jgi:hypothetical protein